MPNEYAEVFGSSYEKILAFYELIVDQGELRGLIGPREIPRIWERHILNSAVLAQFIDVSRETIPPSTDFTQPQNVSRETLSGESFATESTTQSCANVSRETAGEAVARQDAQDIVSRETQVFAQEPNIETSKVSRETAQPVQTNPRDGANVSRETNTEQLVEAMFHVKQSSSGNAQETLPDAPNAKHSETEGSLQNTPNKPPSKLLMHSNVNNLVKKFHVKQSGSKRDTVFHVKQSKSITAPCVSPDVSRGTIPPSSNFAQPQDVSRETLSGESFATESTTQSCANVSRETAGEAVARHDAQNIVSRETKQRKKLVDVGSGAGFPGLVLACMLPELDVYLVESMQRRTDWLSFAAAELGLSNVQVIRARAEDVQKSGSVPPADYVTARAVAPLKRLLGWTMPFLKPGGELIALKGSSVGTEIKEAEKVLKRFTKHAPEVLEARVLPDVESTTVLRLKK